MSKTYVAVDIGASSGRLMHAELVDNKLSLREIHRFKNGFVHNKGHDCWDIDKLIEEILIGLGKIKKAGYDSVVLGIDTWAVDYVLVDQKGDKLQDSISYRDNRTHGSMEKLTTSLSKKYIYQKTGIQFLDFNTLYQLFEEDKELLAKTDKIMMIPDYIGFILTGKAVTEVTNASTTQMLSLREGLFDNNLLKSVNVRQSQFPKLVEAGTILGNVSQQLVKKYNLPQTEVVTVATHDTASAVIGTPALGQRWAYLSSGTWSLIGAELNTPENGEQAFEQNYTNEWGAYGTYRFLKNIMGLWIIQNIKKELNDQYSFADLADLAKREPPFQQFIDVNAARFQNPENMIAELQAYCRETKQKVPETPGELAMAVYSNLSLYYARELSILDDILGYHIDSLNIVGGGSNVGLMNQLTATVSGIDVYAGPSEATAIGNIVVQMITKGDILNIYLARQIISDSFEINKFVPEREKYPNILDDYKRFLKNEKYKGGNLVDS
ncbi:rhamnulokinase [Liquorilactobacillus mali]|uniref:Rhamnulokinase n=1 Tax=Liquorilactobacillus mali KCTC 3596 = DSM 20444 TaxID=1046596 RepID=J0UV96_9LACO|nr:rhamnulokinase [Liquorilactobacillus mali]AJA34075.1 rhamnulokinase [Liquorilactobacillus mali KCTC 3596 = DSM 20444]EJF02234.1 rhamnulokinase [Liquorilactobacillus mali KCTC 3596 = DSM 20444]KRN11099.1 rhamnulokinase [Liquorilactobacillus mali KCTC 3596 = DSM 20444]MDC7953787.1 rhamnulokinase [Liquorilactobacillus mali]MDV7757493.1 rhamnulokinase [Liquorilactobacillus mali]